MSFTRLEVEPWDSVELQARRAGIKVDDVSDAISMLVEIGYKLRTKCVETWLEPKAMERVFRIMHKVYELPPVTDFDPLQLREPTNIIKTETREVRIRDHISTSSDTITYS
jgi:hypothetical protein